MARVAVRGGGVYTSRRYLCRPVKSGPAFSDLTRLIAKNLPSGVLYVPEPRHSAHVSLLDPPTLRTAISRTRRRHKLQPDQLIPRLREAMPSSRDKTLTASIARVERLGRAGMTLAVIFDCPEVDEERECAFLHLKRLGNVSLSRHTEPCHASLGKFTEWVPQKIVDLASQNLPDIFTLGVVLPDPAELTLGQHLPRAA